MDRDHIMPNATKPRRVDGYIRVSRVQGREGPSYQSPSNQRATLERWAEYRGIDIATWHVDEDQSGGTQNRPGLNEAMARIEAGETDGIACWSIDRFSRSVIGGLTDIKRISEAGAHIAFVSEDIDTTGPGGRLVLTTMLAQGEYMLDNLKSGWRTSKANAIARGALISPTPVGYLRGPDGVMVIDPDAGPLLREAFALAAGRGLDAARRHLVAHLPKRTWKTFTLKRVLSNRVYLGVARYGDLVNDTAHEPLVDRATFEACQRAIREHGDAPRRSPETFPLSGVASCAGCGSSLVGGRGGADARRTYRCSGRCDHSPTISAELLERHVIDTLRAAFDHPGFRVGDETLGADVAIGVLEDAERELDAFASDLTARKALGERYHHHLQVRAVAVDEAREALHAVLAAQQQARVMVPAELWDSLTAEELAIVLRGGLDTVTVRRGRGLSVAERVVVVPKGLNGSDAAGA
jgi:site-specific DNA recombinase